MIKSSKLNYTLSKKSEKSKNSNKSETSKNSIKSDTSKNSEKSKKIIKNEKLNVVLDIDETLLYFIQKKYQSYSWDIISEEEKNKYKDNIRSFKNGNILILRPNLDKFLKFLFKNCNVSIWSASDYDYVEFVVEEYILPYGTPKYILSERQGTLARKLHGNTKDLNLLWYNSDNSNNTNSKTKYHGFTESNTILIDDLPNATQNPSNKNNSIAISRFALFGEAKDRSEPYRDVSNDDSLLQVIDLLRKLIIYRKQSNIEDLSECIFSKNNLKKIKEFYNNSSNNNNNNSNIGINNYIKRIKYNNKLSDIVAIGSTYHFHGGSRAK